MGILVFLNNEINITIKRGCKESMQYLVWLSALNKGDTKLYTVCTVGDKVREK